VNALLVSARHELLSVRRSRTGLLLAYVFVGMVVASTAIGWATNRTVTGVYDEISAEGLTSVANPFTGVSLLYYARNAIIYVIVVGALMAIVLGAQATLRDRKAGTSDLVASRPISSAARLGGQAAGLGAVFAGLLVVGLGTCWVLMGVIDGAALAAGPTLRLAGFAAVSWALLMLFALLGMVTGLRSRREGTALLVPFVIWSLVTFVLPQIGTAARPVALLNPVPPEAVSGGGFAALHAVTGPLSITEQFKQAAGVLLDEASQPGRAVGGVVLITGAVAAMAALVLLTQRRTLRKAVDG
jgi:ABC-2 type transport system permease protein